MKFINISDIHIRFDTPICRTDNFLESFLDKLLFIKELQEKHNCPVLCNGDLFNNWKNDNEVLSEFMPYLPKKLYTVAGQHDLRYHRIEDIRKSSIWTLREAGLLDILNFNCIGFSHGVHVYGKSWNEPCRNIISKDMINILVTHEFTYLENNEPFPDCGSNTAQKLLRDTNFDYILTGDNHQQFVYEKDGRFVVNPGSLMRTSIDQKEHTPACFLIDTEKNTVEKILIPIKKNVISDEHRDNEIDVYIEKTQDTEYSEIDFETELDRVLNQKNVKKEVKTEIYKSMETK